MHRLTTLVAGQVGQCHSELACLRLFVFALMLVIVLRFDIGACMWIYVVSELLALTVSKFNSALPLCLHHRKWTRYLAKHRGCMVSRSASSSLSLSLSPSLSLSAQEAFITEILDLPIIKWYRKAILFPRNAVHSTRHTHTHTHTHVPYPHQIRQWPPSLHAQIVKWVFLYIIYVFVWYVRVCVRHLFAFHTPRTCFYICCICLFCKQVWVLPFVHVNKIVETQIEVREHLEKVHRRYITEILQHTTTEIIPLSKYSSFKIQIYLRDV